MFQPYNKQTLTRRHSGCPSKKEKTACYQCRPDAFYQLRYIVCASMFLPHADISIEVSYVKRPSERHSIYKEEEKQKRDVDWERERWKGDRTGQRGRGSKVGHISLARVTVAFLIKRVCWELCPIKNQMWNKHAGHLERTYAHAADFFCTCRCLLGSVPCCSLLLPSLHLICLHNQVRSQSQGARSQYLTVFSPLG